MGKYSFSKFSQGFTLIEILITIALIGVMAAGITTLLNPLAQIQKANDAKRKGDLNQIQKAVETYYSDVGSYPPNPSTEDYRIKGFDGNPVPWGSSWMPYVNTMPKDPSSSKNYIYISTGQAYYLYASLDKETNSLSNLPAGASCGINAVCNYGVSSPNVSP